MTVLIVDDDRDIVESIAIFLSAEGYNVLKAYNGLEAADGGGVEFVDLTDDMVVLVELTGACGNCPHSSRTLKNGIEKTIKSILPEIKAVENVK